ncbi:hypothetical protein GCM10009682_36670 [Luedemannella flava]|uniref:Uncharacterized protein n=1 Tax=Luedemannella flava TaxID=349316 RepID=A0ABP4YD73_9ACTN
MNELSSQPLPQRTRPGAVLAATILLVISGVLGLVGITLLTFLLEDTSPADLVLLLVVPGVASVANLILAVLLFRGVSWARITLIVLIIANIVLTIISALVDPSGICLSLVFNIVLLVLLFREDVKDWCYPY